MAEIVTLPEVKAHLGLGDEFDDELTLLIADASARIDDLAGPVMEREVVERVTLSRGYGLLSHVPLGAVVSVTGSTGGSLTGWSVDDIGGIGGLRTAPLGFLPDGSYGAQVTVTYNAGRVPADQPAPARFKRAALRYIAWSWRRDHGGSESYMPAGDDATPGLGVAGIDKELRFILGSEVRAGRVA